MLSQLLLVISVILLLLGVAYLAAVVVVAHRFTKPRRVLPPALAASDAELLERVEFAARGDALPIAAWYGAAPGASSAVIMVHGRDACRADALRGDTMAVASRLMADGMSVLMIDLRGHGESGNSRLTFGHHERRDVLGAVDHLLSRGYLPQRIGVFGASMGGASGIAAAAEEPAIGALITDSSFADLESLLRVQFQRLTRLPCWCLRGALVAASVLTRTRLTARPPHQVIRRLRGRPTLVIHAAGDSFVPVRHAQLLARAGDAQLWITPGTRHLSSATAAGERYAAVVAEFFGTALLNRVSAPALVA